MPPHKIEQFRGIQFGAIRINSMSLDCMQWVSMHVRVFLCTLGNFWGDYKALDRISEAIFVVIYIYQSSTSNIEMYQHLNLLFENT